MKITRLNEVRLPKLTAGLLRSLVLLVAALVAGGTLNAADPSDLKTFSFEES